LIAQPLQILGPLAILQCRLYVLTAVHLANELGLNTQEIDDVRPYELLPAKLAAFLLAVTKPAPQQLLGSSLLPAQCAGKVFHGIFDPLTLALSRRERESGGPWRPLRAQHAGPDPPFRSPR
jgi:hypothetical protein